MMETIRKPPVMLESRDKRGGEIIGDDGIGSAIIGEAGAVR